MKYEVPEINISKFSMENVVTVSARQIAKEAVKAELGSSATIISTKLTLDDWVAMK